jgi:taurine dioxygenase
VVRTHPATGRPALFVNPHFTTGIEGMTEEESRAVLSPLYDAATRPENIYRHRWRAGDVVMWDNRCTMHYAVMDYTEDMQRLMHRTTAGGEVPR